MSHGLARWAMVPLACLAAGCSVVGYPAPVPTPAGSSGREPAGAGVGSVDRASDPAPVLEPPSRFGNPESYEVFGRTYYVLASAEGYDQEGWASWYGEEFAGRRTSSGEVFDPDRISAAHRTLPLPTWVEVVNLDNGRRLTVRVNDRGPFADTGRRIIDLSRAAARRLGVVGPGVARVRVRALTPAELAERPRPGPLGGGGSPPGR